MQSYRESVSRALPAAINIEMESLMKAKMSKLSIFKSESNEPQEAGASVVMSTIVQLMELNNSAGNGSGAATATA